jgi:predicted small lipoprotein YifL
MFGVVQILVSAGAAAILVAGCGQRGPLYLPTGEAAANRATLPQVLTGRGAGSTATVPETAAPGPAPVTPPTGVANPVRNR